MERWLFSFYDGSTDNWLYWNFFIPCPADLFEDCRVSIDRHLLFAKRDEKLVYLLFPNDGNSWCFDLSSRPLLCLFS